MRKELVLVSEFSAKFETSYKVNEAILQLATSMNLTDGELFAHV